MDPFPLFLSAVAAAGLHGAWKQARQARRATASRGWPVADARIERSEIVRERAGSGQSGEVWVPRIEYVYEAAGRTRRGSRITFASELYTSFPDRARAKCARYFEGAKVPVYFDPADPDTACLERPEGAPIVAWALVALFAALACGAGGVAASYWLG